MTSPIKPTILLLTFIFSLAKLDQHLTLNQQKNQNSQQLISDSKPKLESTIPQAHLPNKKLSAEMKFKYYIFEEQCYDTFFNQRNFFHFQCLKLTLSKFVGYALVYGSLIVKAPQIIKILLNCSTIGISFTSVIIECFMNALMIGYNIHRQNPFSIYGQNVFLGSSNLLIIFSFFMFSKEKKTAKYIRETALLFIISTPLILQIAPSIVIENSLWIGIIAFIVSRFEQVRQNHKNKSTGNLSFLTTFFNFGGNVARTFTVLTQASGDTLFLLSNVFPIFINGYIVIQFILYWNNKISYNKISYEAVFDQSKEQIQIKKQQIKDEVKST